MIRESDTVFPNVRDLFFIKTIQSEISTIIIIVSWKLTAEVARWILLTINLRSKLEKSAFPNNNHSHKLD